jgi:hypothetical protein
VFLSSPEYLIAFITFLFPIVRWYLIPRNQLSASSFYLKQTLSKDNLQQFLYILDIFKILKPKEILVFTSGQYGKANRSIGIEEG